MKTGYFSNDHPPHRRRTWLIRSWGILLCLIFSISEIEAQHYLAFDQPEAPGMGAVTITDMAEGPGGFLWVASEQGLFRYDGYTFYPYTCPRKGQPSTKDIHVTCLYRDSQHRLWAGTISGQVLRYHPAGDSMRLIWNPEAGANQNQAYPQIREIIEDTLLGDIWVGHSTGLLHIQADSINQISTAPYPSTGHVLSYELRSLTLFNRHLWLGYREGHMSAFDLETLSFTHHDFSKPLDYQSIEAQRIIDGIFWVVGDTRGVYRFDPDSLQFVHEEVTSPITSVEDILPRKAGGYWIASASGLIEWDPAHDHSRRYTHQLNDPLRSLPATPVKAIYQQGNTLWIGSGTEGLARAALDAPFQYARIHANAQSAEWHHNTTLYRDRSGRLLAGFFSGGTARFYPDGEMEWYRESDNEKGTVFSFLRQDNGDLYVGRYGTGLEKWPWKSAAPEPLSSPEDASLLPALDVRGLVSKDDGTMWIATHGHGLFSRKANGKNFRPFQQSEPSIDAWQRCVWVDSVGGIWLGCVAGLYHLRPDAERFEALRLPQNGMHQIDTYQFLPGKGDTIYAVTHLGLLQIDAQNQITVLDSRFGLDDSRVHLAFVDADQHLWAATRKILHRWNGRRFEPKLWLDSEDSFSPGAVEQMPDSSVFLGLRTGIMQFFPHLMAKTPLVPLLHFMQLRINHQLVSPGDATAILHLPIEQTETIYLEPEHRVFTLEFGINNPSRTQNPVYAYRLAGFEKDWNEIGQRREATYTSLPPGNFSLEVKVRYAGGQEAIRKLQVIVAPPLWQTWWAYALYSLLALLVLGAIWYFQYLSHRLAIEAASRQQEQQFYSMRNQLFTYISHELRTPLTLIMGSLEPLKAGAKRWNDTSRERLTFIDRHTQRLMRLVNQLMDFRRLEENVLELNPSRVDMAALVPASIKAFETNAAHRNLHFRIKLPTDPTFVLGDMEKLEQILYNLFSNATKYAPAGSEIQVHLTSCQKTSKTTLRVWNPGPGLEPSTLQELFTPFVRGSGERSQPGSGIGLAFTKALVELHGGDIRLESAPGAGVTALVQLPCAAAQTQKVPLQVERPVVDHSAKALPVLLVADDQPDIRSLIQREYQRDFQIIQASNGLEALEMAFQDQPDIILLDVRMPGGPDGISVCQQLKRSADTRHIPIVMLSAQDTTSDQVAGLEKGADEYVTKPFSVEVLRALLKSQLRNRQLVREQTMQSLLKRDTPQAIPEQAPAEDPFLSEIIHLVQQHLKDPGFGVEQLLTHMPYGKSHLYRRIKQLTGQSPAVFIRTLRVREAARILQDQPLAQVAEIAYQVGFKDPAYFSRCFKDVYGVAPSGFPKLPS